MLTLGVELTSPLRGFTMSDDGNQRWHELVQLASKQKDSAKLFAIVEELCVQLRTVESQLHTLKLQSRKTSKKHKPA
jgi:hypothetical protein